VSTVVPQLQHPARECRRSTDWAPNLIGCTPRGLWPRKRVSERPTELQGSEGKPEVLTPYADRHGWGGELALDKMHSGYTAFEYLLR
jgi:hypothetical protein